VNGLKAVIYCFGMSASRYIEYSVALKFLSPKSGQFFLEVGCGHSILPTFWQKLGMETLVLDTNRNALRWQARKSKEMAVTTNVAFLGDARYLPFKDRSIDAVSCISTIEHIPGDDDTKTASEIGRVLKDDGICIMSLPLSQRRESYIRRNWAVGIPPLMQRALTSFLPTILSKFNVDRTCSYFERFFSQEDLDKRIIRPSQCIKEDYLTIRSGRTIKIVHQKIIPTGVLTILEYLVAKFLTTSKQTKNADAIIMKLKKVNK